MYTNKDIWKVSYPILLALLAQNVINVTDTAFLGHVGEVELGASAMGGLLYICIFTVTLFPPPANPAGNFATQKPANSSSHPPFLNEFAVSFIKAGCTI